MLNVYIRGTKWALSCAIDHPRVARGGKRLLLKAVGIKIFRRFIEVAGMCRKPSNYCYEIWKCFFRKYETLVD